MRTELLRSKPDNGIGGSVDWFHFWFQDCQDPDPAKQAQYVRWRELRRMQEENDKKEKEAKAPAVN